LLKNEVEEGSIPHRIVLVIEPALAVLKATGVIKLIASQQSHSDTCLARIMIFIKFDIFIFIVLEERWRVDFHIRRGWPWLEVIENMRGPWFFIFVTRIAVVALK
jgi:hypothetical protein